MDLDANTAAALRAMALTYGALATVFATVATAAERRAGPRWLPLVWALAVLSVLAMAFAAWQRHPLRARYDALWPEFAALGAVGFGVPFALAALAVWRLGRRAARPQPAAVQWAAAVAAFLLGAPLGIVGGIAVEALLG